MLHDHNLYKPKHTTKRIPNQIKFKCKSKMLHDHNLYKPKDAAPNESQIKSNSIANDLHNPKDDLYNPKDDLCNPKDAQSQG